MIHMFILAQSAPNAPAADAGGQIPTVAELFMTSVWINGVIAALSLIAVALFLYLFLTLTRGSFAPSRFLDELTKLITRRRFDQAIQLCQTHRRAMTAPIVQRLIENREKDPNVLMSIIESEGSREAERVWGKVGYLSEIAAIAPTLGLLGTVVGMIKVFFTLTTRIAEAQGVGDLSAGIAEAMSTTMFGLIVAILAGVFYMITRSRATAVLSDAEAVCHGVADHVHRAAAKADDERAPGEPRPVQEHEHEEGLP